MDAERWKRIQALFHRAAELPDAERAAFVDVESLGDADLAERVHRLLRADADDAALVDQPIGDVAGRVLAEGVPAPDVRFGPYHILRLLGEGGMGVVYLAERDDLRSQVAVKVLRDAWLSPARRDRFAAEQRTLAQLNHPGIARLYDAGTLADGTPWIAMEYVDGVTLIEYCRAQHCTLAERLRLFRDVCDAVQHAHRHLVVHRDLKPSNVMVTADGGVKLLDFGIAKQLETQREPDVMGDGDVQLTRTGMRPMTPAYAAPEQLRGAPVGVHTDVYSLGVMLYELLAGRLPFDVTGRTPEEAASLILSQVAERPSVAAARGGTGVPNVSAAAWADLDVLSATAMHPDAQRRYQTVEALARDVDHFLKGEPLDARPDSVRYRLGKFARRHRNPLVAAGAAFALVVALVTFYTLRLAEARDAALAESARTQRVQRFTLNLFNGGDENQGPSDSLRVVTLLDRGVEEIQALGNEPVVQADMLYTLGNVFEKLGRYDRADSLLQASLDRRRRLLGAEHADVAASLVALAQVREDQAKLPEAERLARDGLAMMQRVRPPDHPDVPNAMTALGRVLQARAQIPQSIAVLEEAVRLQSASGSPRDLALSLQTLAVGHFYAGHYSAADSLQRVALAIDRRLYGERHPQVATDLMDIGSVQFERANYAVAERAYREGMSIFESWYGKDHPQIGAGLTLWAQALIKLQRAGEAVPLLERSLAIEQRVHPGPHPRVAGALNALGAANGALGRQAEAEQYYLRTTDMLRALYGPNHYLVGAALGNQASTWIARNDPARAEGLLRDALAIYAKSLPPEHMYVGVARAKLGRALTRQSRWRDAEPQLLAAYAIVQKQAPTSEWTASTRADLTTVYTALGRTDDARKYRVAVGDSTVR